LTEVEVSAEARGHTKRIKIVEASADVNDPGQPIRATFDGQPETGWGVRYGHSKEHQAAFLFERPLRASRHTVIKVRLRQESEVRRATIARFKLALSTLAHPTHDRQGLPEDVLKALREAPEKRSEEQKKKVVSFYRRVAPELTELRRRLAALEAERSLLQASLPTVLVSEAVEPRTMRVLPRGDWMNDSGEVVQPAVPQFLSQTAAKSALASRLDLADWLVSPENPLTARAMMNRFWKLFFGAGLSRTLEDLGVQGEWPTHPELLDWLAVEFRESGWDMKHMIELIVTSTTYRQTSRSTPQLDERDPQNRLWARQNRLRLEAEFIRDNALAVAGLLVNQVGGRSVFPYQPEGYWAPLNFPKREYVLDRGDNLYRRGVYLHWQRTFPHPSLVAFDAPAREECTAARPVSNTPLQALVLLNDPNFVEAARVFGQNILRHGGRTFEKRLDWAYRKALARPPTAEESKLLARLYQAQLERYRRDAAAAKEFVEVGNRPGARTIRVAELAAWTSLAHALLNLHETITRY
jgi:hypothetical protein